EKYLRRCLEAMSLEDHHRASSRYEPLLDAVAASELELARRIVSLSPVSYMDGHEYEDDYCYAQILHELLQGRPDRNRISRLLERFEVYVGREPNVRLEMGRALAFGTQHDFEAAFEGLLQDQEEHIAADKDRGQLEEPEVMALRQVFIE